MSYDLPNTLDEEYVKGYKGYYLEVMSGLGIKPTPYTEEEIAIIEKAQMSNATADDNSRAERVIQKHEKESEEQIFHMQAFFAQSYSGSIELKIH